MAKCVPYVQNFRSDSEELGDVIRKFNAISGTALMLVLGYFPYFQFPGIARGDKYGELHYAVRLQERGVNPSFPSTIRSVVFPPLQDLR